MTRRAMLSKLMLGATAVASGAIPVRLGNSTAVTGPRFSCADESLLEELERASFRLFWECAQPDTGLVLDRAVITARDKPAVASVAATGFGLTALCLCGSARLAGLK